APPWVEGVRLVPDGEEDVLDDLLGCRAVQRLGDPVAYQWPMPAVEELQSVLPPKGEGVHQRFVAEVLNWRHRSRGRHPGLRFSRRPSGWTCSGSLARARPPGELRVGPPDRREPDAVCR